MWYNPATRRVESVDEANGPMRCKLSAFAATPWIYCFSTIALPYDVFFPRKHPSGFPSMSHRFPPAPFSFPLDASEPTLVRFQFRATHLAHLCHDRTCRCHCHSAIPTAEASPWAGKFSGLAARGEGTGDVHWLLLLLGMHPITILIAVALWPVWLVLVLRLHFLR
jgi:hypothetical protein